MDNKDSFNHLAIIKTDDLQSFGNCPAYEKVYMHVAVRHFRIAPPCKP